MPSPHRPPLNLKLALYAFFDELGPLLAIFTLWFDNHGITTAQVSVVFALWATIGLVLEVPSGVIADRFDRRKVLAFAITLRAIGIAIWLIVPTYAGILVGAGLWAVHTSASSGTWEALVYDQIGADASDDRYAVTMARLGQLNFIGTALSAGAAALLLAAGTSFEALGWITVALHLVLLSTVAALAKTEPLSHGDHEEHDDEEHDDEHHPYLSTLRAGWHAIRLDRSTGSGLRWLALICVLLEGTFILDEYVPLIARDRGVADAVVPVFVIAVWIGLIAGGEIAARRPRLDRVPLGALLGFGAACGVGAMLLDTHWSVGLVALTYAAMNTSWVIGEARLQERAPAAARATVRSLVAFVAVALNLILFGAIGLIAELTGSLARGMLIAVAVVAATTLLIAGRLPKALTATGPSAPSPPR